MAAPYNEISQRNSKDFLNPRPFILTRMLNALLAPPQIQTSDIVILDISHHNGIVNMEGLKSLGVVGVVIKCTERTNYVDDKFTVNWNNALGHGLYVGAYHFFRGNYSGIQQAEHFYNHMLPMLNTTSKKVFPPMVDIETADGVSINTRVTRAYDCLQTIKSKTGLIPMIYSSPSLWNALMCINGVPPAWTNQFYGHVAHWTSASSPALPTGWTSAKTKLWQRGVSGKHGWIPSAYAQYVESLGGVDYNLFLGTMDELKDLIGVEDPPPPPPPPPPGNDMATISITKDVPSTSSDVILTTFYTVPTGGMTLRGLNLWANVAPLGRVGIAIKEPNATAAFSFVLLDELEPSRLKWYVKTVHEDLPAGTKILLFHSDAETNFNATMVLWK